MRERGRALDAVSLRRCPWRRCATATSTVFARCSIRQQRLARRPVSPGRPFPGNVIPRNRWDPLFPKLLALYPLPTDPSRIVNNYFYAPSESNDVNTYDVKGDHNINDKSRSRRERDRFEPGPLPLPADGGLSTTTVINSNSLAATHTYTVGPSSANNSASA